MTTPYPESPQNNQFQTPPQNGMGTAALVMGILQFFCLGFIGSILAIVFGKIGMNKAEIIERGLALAVPFEFTWSCYEANDEACGECESCRLRLTAFERVGSADPIRYRSA